MVDTVPSTTVSPQTGRLLFVDLVQPDREESPRSAFSDRSWARLGIAYGGEAAQVFNINPSLPNRRHQEDHGTRAARMFGFNPDLPSRDAEIPPAERTESERMQYLMSITRETPPPERQEEDRSNRAQDLQMIASHANVEGLNLPPDLIALAYDRNDGEVVDALVDLTEPAMRRQLERDLAERREEEARARERAPLTPEELERFRMVMEQEEREMEAEAATNNGPLGMRSEEEEEEEPPDARELDLWLLESQVPGCTRERAERAYAQGNEDVSRALPLARMSTLLADRDAMIVFLREQHHQATLEEAEVSYELMEGDVVEAAAHMVRGIRWRTNEPALSARRMHTVRLRTVFHLALLYRERYRQEPDEDTLPAGRAVRTFTATAEEALRRETERVLQPSNPAEAENVPPAPDRAAAEEEPSVEQRAAIDFTAARFATLRPSSAPAPAPDAVAELNETLAAGDEERPPRSAVRERMLAALQRANGPPERPAGFTGITGTPWRYTREHGWTRVSEEERADVGMAAAAERERRFQQNQVRTSWGAPTVGELRRQFEERAARAEREGSNPNPRAHRPEAFAREYPLSAWNMAQSARDQELQQQRRRLAETEHWPEGQVFVRNRLRTLLTETLVAHAEREHILGRQVALQPPWVVVLQTVRRWDGRGTNEADVREVLDDAARLRQQALGAAVEPLPAYGGRSFYREDEDDPIEDASDTESDGSPAPVRLASASSSDGEDAAQAAAFRPPSGARRRDIVMASRSGWPNSVAAARVHPGRAVHPAPLPSPPVHERIKQSLRVVQERLDAEMASAAQGEVLSEGAYVDMMNAIKKVWEAVDMAFVA